MWPRPWRRTSPGSPGRRAVRGASLFRTLPLRASHVPHRARQGRSPPAGICRRGRGARGAQPHPRLLPPLAGAGLRGRNGLPAPPRGAQGGSGPAGPGRPLPGGAHVQLPGPGAAHTGGWEPPRPHQPLRPGARLPPGAHAAAAPAGRLHPRGHRPPGAGHHRRGQQAADGAGVRRPRRAGLGGPQRLPDPLGARLVAVPGRTAGGCGAGAGRAGGGPSRSAARAGPTGAGRARPGGPAHAGELRLLHGLHRRLPHGRHRGRPHGGCAPLHLLPHHRAEGPHSPRVAGAHGRPGVRVRRVPGGVPLEPRRPPGRRRRLRSRGAPGRARRALPGGPAGPGRSRVPGALRRHAGGAYQAPRAAAQRGHRPGQRRPAHAPGAGDPRRRPGRRGAPGARRRRLGGAEARAALRARLPAEPNAEVRSELLAALQGRSPF